METKSIEIICSNFFLGGIASIGATVVTNPLEVIKTRLQLQGELTKKGTYTKKYNGTFHGLIQVAKYDGIRGLQKGLSAALLFQFTINALRLGIYDTAVAFDLTKASRGNESFLRSSFWGGLGGCVGSCAGSPFFLISTHLKSFSRSEIAVGYQRADQGLINAFRTIFRVNGIRGLYRGVIGNIPRSALGSGSQLATFAPTKDFLRQHNLYFNNSIYNSFICALIAGSVMAVVTTPFDVILTRLYNQPVDHFGKGKYYRGVANCLWKILKTEGIQGLYKAFLPSYIRTATHSTLLLMFYDEMKSFRNKHSVHK